MHLAGSWQQLSSYIVEHVYGRYQYNFSLNKETVPLAQIHELKNIIFWYNIMKYVSIISKGEPITNGLGFLIKVLQVLRQHSSEDAHELLLCGRRQEE